ncbi:transposase [Streptomyces europaeiscabiei]|nr:transposase [Streptomyces europaeiscabiei]
MESLHTADVIELIRVLAHRTLQDLIKAEATARIVAELGEHTETRTRMRNGYRGRRTCKASPLVAWTTWSRPSAGTPGSPRPHRAGAPRIDCVRRRRPNVLGHQHRPG